MKSRRLLWVHIGVLAAVTCLLYSRSFGNEFLFRWDDHWVVINPFTEQGLSWNNFIRVLTVFYHGQYAPLNELFYMTLFSIDGYNPAVFHVGSVLLHTVNVLLVYVFTAMLLSEMAGGDKSHGNYDKNRRDILIQSFVTALLFAVHPVCVESVAWMSASKVPVYVALYLAGLCVYLRYVRTGSRGLYLLVLLCFILSFGGKEQAVVFFLSCLLVDYAVKREGTWRFFIVEKLPMVILALFFGVVTILSQAGHSASGMPHFEFPERCLLACYSLFEYLMKALLPFNLSYIYPFPYLPGEPVPAVLYFYPVVLMSIGGVVWIYRKNRLLVFAALFFVVNLLVALHIIPLSRFVVTADRYSYISIVAVCLILAQLYARYMRGGTAPAALVALTVYAGALTWNTWSYQAQWHDSAALKSDMRSILKTRQDFIEMNQPEEEDSLFSQQITIMQ